MHAVHATLGQAGQWEEVHAFYQSCSRCCRAWITYSKTLPAKFPFPARSFVKASFFDATQSLLVSKSVLYPPLPPVRISVVEQMLSACMQQEHHVHAEWALQ